MQRDKLTVEVYRGCMECVGFLLMRRESREHPGVIIPVPNMNPIYGKNLMSTDYKYIAGATFTKVYMEWVHLITEEGECKMVLLCPDKYYEQLAPWLMKRIVRRIAATGTHYSQEELSYCEIVGPHIVVSDPPPDNTMVN